MNAKTSSFLRLDPGLEYVADPESSGEALRILACITELKTLDVERIFQFSFFACIFAIKDYYGESSMRKLFELIDKNFFRSQLNQVLKKKSQDNPHPLICISREHGSGGSIIAERVARALGRPWKVYHHEIVSRIADAAHLERKLINEVDESKIPLIEEIVGDFFGKRYISLNSYSRHLLRILSTIGNRGNAIIVGRGANFLFPDALKVRIVGDMEERLRVIVKHEKITGSRAAAHIEASDKKRALFIKELFQHDPRKPHHYDIVIRTSDSLSVEEATEVIVRLAKRRFRI